MAADAAVTFLLEKVTAVITGYSDLISGATKELKQLQDDVKLLNTVLQNLSSASSKDDSVKKILEQVRDVVYEVEDTIDLLLTQAAASKHKSKFKRGLSALSPNHISLAKQVKSLREDKVKGILEKAMAMPSSQGSASTSKEEEDNGTRRKDHVVREQKLVNRDEKEEIIGSLLEAQRPELDIIAVIGIPGMGKTTLAWQIFNDEKIRYEFPIRIWVRVSQRFDIREVLVKIMEHFTDDINNLYSMSNQELHNAVLACLSREKFLLVLDDVWNTEHLDDLKSALPVSNGYGKVLITSRDKGVGKHATESHQLKYLGQEKSWDLLQLEVFGEIGRCPSELHEIGKDISKTCKGVPLTIVVIGGVLKDHYLSSESNGMVQEKWAEMAKHGKIGLDDNEKIISDAVALTYDRLPHRLKDCFIYLGVFPAGYEIPTWTLTRLWIAEGFIQPDDNRSLEEIAKDYLNDLIKRNLLMAHKINPMGEVKVCLVLDIIRDFCVYKAEEQNIFQEIKMEDGHTDALMAKMQEIRRLCLHSDLHKFFSANLKGPRVRSFLCFRKDVTALEPEQNSVFPANFTSLRILHSTSIKFDRFPHKVTKLVHLRYIVLCAPDLTILPEPLSQLWNLQTITVDTNSNSITMKANLWNMIQLRHVKTKAAIVLDKTWQGEAGKNIQTLDRLSPESVTAAMSKNASHLKTLGVRGELDPLFQNMPLGKMDHLEKLKLYHAEASKNRPRRFPHHNDFPPNLKRLTLSNTFLDWQHMSTLAFIRGLEVLKLKDNAFTGIIWEVQNQSFRELQALHILISDLVVWKASDSSFPCLRHLELKKCEKLNDIPDCILQRLKHLDIDSILKSIADSAKNLAIHRFEYSDLL